MIGLIFGDTDFPKEILKTVKKKKIKYLIVDLSKANAGVYFLTIKNGTQTYNKRIIKE